MSVCPVCGCKTDELDFSEYKLGENTVKICSFCGKQLGNIETKEVGEPQLRWLDAVIAKDVPDRSAEILQSLETIRSRFPMNSDAPANESNQQFNRQPQKTNLQKNAVSQNGGMSQSARSNPQTNYDVASLEARVKKLEAELARMKKAQFIKTVLEIVIPIILFLLILIIFFSSGLYDGLKGIAGDFQSYMMKTSIPVFLFKGGF